MHDIRLIEADWSRYRADLARRGAALPEDIFRLATNRRTAIAKADYERSEKKRISREIYEAIKDGRDSTGLKSLAAAIDHLLIDCEIASQTCGDSLETILLAIPNRPHDDVPPGLDPHEIRRVPDTEIPHRAHARDHVALGEALGLMDFKQTVEISGPRFTTLRGDLAKLERAIGAFMLDQAGERGFIEHSVPAIVNAEALVGTGQLPKFADDLYRLTNGAYLIPTGEVSLTNLVRDRILTTDELPLKLCALTPCFRSEAGSAGRDTRGMIRQHQFNKVEIVTVTTPKDARRAHEEMVTAAEEILLALDLPFRTVELACEDLGFSARKTYDIEVWLPSQNTYREISSVSDCGDFQARRMNARFKRHGAKSTEFVHTLNGSALAVGRTLVATMENYQDADGRIRVPVVLQRYLGKEIIG